MQLILDAETTTIDIQSKMSAVEQESFNEKFANNIIENFSNDSVSNSDEIITPAQITVVSDIEEIFEQDKINNETHKPESNNISINGDCDKNKSDDITSSESNETLTKISDTCITEINESKENANHDKNISQCYDFESRSESSSQSLEEKPNLCQSKPGDLLNKDINKLEVNIAESSESIKENACFSDKDPTDVNEKATDSGTENVKNNNSEIEVPKNSQNVDMLENFEEQNDDNVFRIEPNNIENVKSVCSTLNTKDFDSNAEQTLNTEDILALSEQNEVSSNSTTGIINEKNLKSTCAKNCNEAINIDEAYLDGEQGVEIKQISLKNDHQSDTQFIEKIGVPGNVDELKKNNVVEGNKKLDEKKIEEKKKSSLICKLSNTLDILSDDEDEQSEVPQSILKPNNDNQCLSVEDDDDIMLIDEDICAKKDSVSKNSHIGKTLEQNDTSICNENICSNETVATDIKNESATEKPVEILEKSDMRNENKDLNENLNMRSLLPCNFLKTCKKNLADMTREDLEEFCILKIVESVVDRSSLGDIKTQLKTMALTVEEYKKKAMMLTKQNRDLQVVLKSIQEEQKKTPGYPITPLKITRSVGMQVLMTDKPFSKRKNVLGINSSPTLSSNVATEKLSRNTLQKSQKNTGQQIPVPRLVPAANNTATKSNLTQTNTIAPGKPQQTSNALPKSVSNSPPTQKPEKRPRQLSVTVDLTDDEPPTKTAAKSSPAPPVRLVPPQNLMAPQRPQFGPIMNSPRKVYIPISGPQAQNVRPGQTIMLKTVPPNSGPRQKVPPTNNLAKMQSNTIRMNRVQSNRHPAPLPDAMKQYQPPNWKALPPAPDLKLSKVENGIVISWKIDGYQDDSYEEIASYQLYAYQETTSPPSTALWKKIGDVKALPLPMACTLTQFMAGYKYYFAVRAVDVKSRLGPFSLPGSILLLNKM